MNSVDPQRELLVRYLDGVTSVEETERVVEQLRRDPEARAFLRLLSEHAIVVADLERIASSREQALHTVESRSTQRVGSRLLWGVWPWNWRGAAAFAMVLVLVASGWWIRSNTASNRIRITKATGSSRYFGAKGNVDNTPTSGLTLGAGDTLETRSCDAWMDLQLRDGTTLTLGGNSVLRFLRDGTGRTHFELSQGSLWVTPAAEKAGERVVIQTPALLAEMASAQFDLQTSSAESILRVNDGSGQITQPMTGNSVKLVKGQQTHVSLSRRTPLAAISQPTPINRWACDLEQAPEVNLGRWLPSTPTERARLGAEPLLWPVSEKESVLLYAVSLAAWKSSEHPVVLHDASRIRFRGRTARLQTVRLGFSVQKIRGVFAGKFEADIPARALGPVGQTWEVELRLTEFRPLHPQLATSPEGLELTDVYALTIREDAGLEIHHVELVPEAAMEPRESATGSGEHNILPRSTDL